MTPHSQLQTLVARSGKTLADSVADYRPTLHAEEVGRLAAVGHGIAHVNGLSGVKSEELLQFAEGIIGMAFNIDLHTVGAILLDAARHLQAGTDVQRTHRVLEVPVGEALLGRLVDALGRPLDGQGPIHASERMAVERDAPGILDRAPVSVPLQTGLKVVDALIPIGRGQRELILGDRQTGKTAIAVDTIINQRGKDVLCIYCAVGQRSSATAKLVAELQRHHALAYSMVVVTSGDDPAGLQFVAPYAAMTMAEYFLLRGRDVVVVFDDLTRHARAYRELSLLLRRPPGREAYPGDVFYIHSRLLERATRLRAALGGGSITALPIVETEAQNMAAYIPTNLISITDGQIYLSPDLFQKGVLPAVDVGKSVSRVGGKAQLPAYRAVAGDLRLAYSQFEELEAFARFGTRLDDTTRQTLAHGTRVREILKQSQYAPLPVAEQIAVFVAVNGGVFDETAPEAVAVREHAVRAALRQQIPDLCERLDQGEKPTDEELHMIMSTAWNASLPRSQETLRGND
ncbi:MAG: alternate F1F0 ATPase, F1 subunit alpha [Candidatus Binatia bacterium]